MYPLQDDYKLKIKHFLSLLNQQDSSSDDIQIKTSNMSTRLFGEFDALTTLLNNAMRMSMQRYGKIVFVCKFVEGDARLLANYD